MHSNLLQWKMKFVTKMSFLRQKVLFFHQKWAIIMSICQKCTIITSKTCHRCVKYMSLICHSNIIAMSSRSYFGVILVLQLQHFNVMGLTNIYLIISDWLKYCQECAIFAFKTLTSELCHLTLHFLTQFAMEGRYKSVT